MPAPTLVSTAAVAYNTNTTPKVTGSISALAGDVIDAVGQTEDSAVTLGTPVGGSLVWTLRQSIVLASNCAVYAWTAVVDVDKSMTISFSRATSGGGTDLWGARYRLWRGSAGVGASNKATGTASGPSLGLTTTQDNSAIAIAVGDWSAADGTSRAWRTGAGALTEQDYAQLTAYSYYGGYHADAGTAGAKTVGLTAPNQTWAIVAVEIKGTAGPGWTLEQYAARFRNDDGSETTATWAGAENANLTAPLGTPLRIRVGINATGDVPSNAYQLEAKVLRGGVVISESKRMRPTA